MADLIVVAGVGLNNSLQHCRFNASGEGESRRNAAGLESLGGQAPRQFNNRDRRRQNTGDRA